MESVDMQIVGERLRAARQDAGLTQAEVSSAIGLDQPTLARLERARKPGMSVDTLYRLAVVLRVSADYLLGLTADPSPRAKPRRRRPAATTPDDQEPEEPAA